MLTRDTLIDRVWGADYVGDTKTLDVHVKRLRAKVEADPSNPDAHRHHPRPRLQVRDPALTGSGGGSFLALPDRLRHPALNGLAAPPGGSAA